MCGIGAFQIVGGECDPRLVAQHLLRLLEVRGRDASGVAWHSTDGETYIQKAALAGSVLARQLDDSIGTTGIVHTRWATQGSPKHEVNNHPIDASGVVGVHNGHCSNDDELIRMCDGYKRKGEVDSEAIFALIAHGPKDLKLRQRLAKVRGGAALFWLRTGDAKQRLHVARLQSSPLVLGMTKGGSIIGASTESIVREVAKRCKLQLDVVHVLPEGTYMRCENGNIAETQQVELVREWKFRLPDYTKRSTYSAPTTRQDLPKPQSEADQMTLEMLLEAEIEEEIADRLETDTLRDALDRQFGMGRYGDRRW